MRALVQRVTEASVSVDAVQIGRIAAGFLVFLGVGHADTPGHAETLARKTAALRIFPDEEKKMNRSLKDVGGEALIISQFTLYADTRKGHRPAFTDAAPPEPAERLYLAYVDALRREGIRAQTGRFGAMMQVHLVNDGPVTILLES